MAKLYLTLLLALIVVAHATALNIPQTEDVTNPSPNALAPAKTTEALAAAAPADKGTAVGDEKNFISYGGVGGWGGVGGYMGVLPVIGGVGGVGGIGGIGGVGLGKVGGIGAAGGVGGVGGIIP
ncbi:hypothetical protein CASFOL_000393 [Castilleja foliolosa]|uniref:Glycine-rich protein n=1 Tax=Castilleja foliolosa TaxID=1961234 RepID=A0ABD3ENK2_9LAMI